MGDSKPTFEVIRSRLIELDSMTPGISMLDFQKVTGWKKADWMYSSDRPITKWNRFREKCGLDANDRSLSVDTVFEQACRLVIEYGRKLNLEELVGEKKQGKTLPSSSVLRRKGERKWTNGGGMDGFWEKVAEYASLQHEFMVVPELLGVSNPVASGSELDENCERLADLYAETSFVPPIVRCLPQLAEFDDDSRKIDQVFERRVGRAFQVMGLTVEPLGGPNKPDGLVRTSAENTNDPWVIIYDAKKRRDGFRLNKESERQLKDYVKEYGEKLRKEKFKRRYFVFVSSRFFARDEEKARAIKHDLGDAVQHVVFMEAAALVELVNKRLSEGANVFNDKMVSRLFRTGILKAEDIN